MLKKKKLKTYIKYFQNVLIPVRKTSEELGFGFSIFCTFTISDLGPDLNYKNLPFRPFLKL